MLIAQTDSSELATSLTLTKLNLPSESICWFTRSFRWAQVQVLARERWSPRDVRNHSFLHELEWLCRHQVCPLFPSPTVSDVRGR